MKNSRPWSHVRLKYGTHYWVVGQGKFGWSRRELREEREVEVRNVDHREGKLYFWMKVRPHSWSNDKKRKRPKRLLCATRDMHKVEPLGPMELLAKVPLESA